MLTNFLIKLLHLHQNNYEHPLEEVFPSLYQYMLAGTICVSHLCIRRVSWTAMQDFTLFYDVWKTDSLNTYM